MKKKRIYIVDDEQNIRDLIKSYLLKEGYEAEIFSDGLDVFTKFQKEPCDMLVIDIMMPNMDGYTLCKNIRRISDVPIIIVSAKDEEIDRILGLELGSDDYLSKPFSVRELVVRMKNIFRRIDKQGAKQENKIYCVDIEIFPNERRVVKDNCEIEMTSKEYELLYYLVTNKNRVFTRNQLIQGIWGYDHIGDTRAIDNLVKRIRKKLLEIGSKVEIVTVWGYGYKICE